MFVSPFNPLGIVNGDTHMGGVGFVLLILTILGGIVNEVVIRRRNNS